MNTREKIFIMLILGLPMSSFGSSFRPECQKIIEKFMGSEEILVEAGYHKLKPKYPCEIRNENEGYVVGIYYGPNNTGLTFGKLGGEVYTSMDRAEEALHYWKCVNICPWK